MGTLQSQKWYPYGFVVFSLKVCQAPPAWSGVVNSFFYGPMYCLICSNQSHSSQLLSVTWWPGTVMGIADMWQLPPLLYSAIQFVLFRDESPVQISIPYAMESPCTCSLLRTPNSRPMGAFVWTLRTRASRPTFQTPGKNQLIQVVSLVRGNIKFIRGSGVLVAAVPLLWSSTRIRAIFSWVLLYCS